MPTRTTKPATSEAGEGGGDRAPLASMIAQAEALSGAAAPAAAPAPAPEAPKSDGLAEDLGDTLRTARELARPAVWWLTQQRFDELWGDATIERAAEPLAEIFRRNGWTLAGVMGKWGPYLALAAAIGPPALETARTYQVARAQVMREAVRPAEAPAPAAAAGGGNG